MIFKYYCSYLKIKFKNSFRIIYFTYDQAERTGSDAADQKWVNSKGRAG